MYPVQHKDKLYSPDGTVQEIKPTMTCHNCGKTIIKPENSVATGYAQYDDKVICYECCGLLDSAYMEDHDKTTLYLTWKPDTYQKQYKRYGYLNSSDVEVINWPGTLRLNVTGIKKSKVYGIGYGSDRYDVWFTDKHGAHWYGRNQGDNEILHCKKLKQSVNHALKTLMNEAESTAKYRKHTLKWTIHNDHNAVGECVHCGHIVQCLTNPMPNQIDIGGSAVAIDCIEDK